MLTEILPADGSALYTETNMHNLFPEPWNMVSSALFLIPGIYWLIKLKGFNKRHAFLSLATFLMLTGCIGSTVYHGFRQWRFFMYLDWVPIALLCMLASMFFIIKVTGKWQSAAVAVAAFGLVELGLKQLYMLYDKHIMFSINYGVMVLMIVVPLLMLLIKTRWRNGSLVAAAFVSFGFALFFRIIDTEALLPMGTHFLWHTFGAIATSFIFLYIYRLNGFTYMKKRLKHLKEEALVLPMYSDKDSDVEERTGS
ncbi:hypothetical protein IM792_08255 [Mucilaginibacter sp. JRF]|uniref:hypothetical protein n=1 Tax=Mucilaginibacter sp. JRF TaxID=2780088 RepID=UPI00188260FF|nr:hypothetical protein [Mucilaginibacter sp. JRF]MBE9584436.1 hypothetical protein [Mucilaginibacter sp. JRF]